MSHLREKPWSHVTVSFGALKKKKKDKGLQKLYAKETSLPFYCFCCRSYHSHRWITLNNPQLALLGFVSTPNLILARVSALQRDPVALLPGALQLPLLWKKNADRSLRLTQGPVCPAGTVVSHLSLFLVSHLTHLCWNSFRSFSQILFPGPGIPLAHLWFLLISHVSAHKLLFPRSPHFPKLNLYLLKHSAFFLSEEVFMRVLEFSVSCFSPTAWTGWSSGLCLCWSPFYPLGLPSIPSGV